MTGCLARATATGGAMNATVTRYFSILPRNAPRSNEGMMTSLARACRAAFNNTVMP